MLRDRLAGGTLSARSVSEEFVKEAYRLDLKPLVWVMPTEDAKLKRHDRCVWFLISAVRKPDQRRAPFGEITAESGGNEARVT